MAASFDLTTIDALARHFKEPAWLTDLRHKAFETQQQLPWPHPSDEIWRRTDVSLLDPMRGFLPRPPSLFESLSLKEAHLSLFTQPLGEEQLFVRVNGTWLAQPQISGWLIEDVADVAQMGKQGDWIRKFLETDGLSQTEQKLTHLNLAFHDDALSIQIPDDFIGSVPIRLIHALSMAPSQALFPMTIIRVGKGSSVTWVDEYLSLPESGMSLSASQASAETTEAHLVNSRIELVLEKDARVHYVRLQRWDIQAREFLLLRATLGRGAQLTLANLNLGSSLSKTHLITKLMEEQASSFLYGFTFGKRNQHIDQHTLQDHQAPHTSSDLKVRAALQDKSRMIYTGLIRIAQSAQQTNAFQENHNLLLSENTQAETIPMLEILADDVQCKHGASIGPIDEEQIFYAMARGVPRAVAERLVVMGFVEPIIAQVPFEPLRQRLRQEIEGELHGWGAGGDKIADCGLEQNPKSEIKNVPHAPFPTPPTYG